ncbi:MAG: hypothetical protein AVDCRST_MAG59-4650, partial [uncultured Thermomicrobiales bacterium]
ALLRIAGGNESTSSPERRRTATGVPALSRPDDRPVRPRQAPPAPPRV